MLNWLTALLALFSAPGLCLARKLSPDNILLQLCAAQQLHRLCSYYDAFLLGKGWIRITGNIPVIAVYKDILLVIASGKVVISAPSY